MVGTPSTTNTLARKTDKLQDVAEQADRIHEVNSRAPVLAAEYLPVASTSNPQSTWASQMEAFTQQVATLTEQMTNMAKELRKGRSRSRGGPCSKAPIKEGLCYYTDASGQTLAVVHSRARI